MGKTAAPDDELLTPDEVGAMLKVDWKTLRNWRYTRKGPPSFPLSSRAIRYRRVDVQKWIADREKASKTEHP